MNHTTFPFLRFVFVEVDGFAVMMANVDRQLEQNVNVLLYSVQF